VSFPLQVRHELKAMGDFADARTPTDRQKLLVKLTQVYGPWPLLSRDKRRR
jgi:hypothetical protein